MIQTSQQAAAEMKEKIGILQNEIEILQNETNAKEKALGDEHKVDILKIHLSSNTAMPKD